MDKHYDNLGVLEDFLEANGIKKDNVVRFNSIFTVTTKKGTRVEHSRQTTITFNSYNDEGIVSILDSGSDTADYPSVFKAKFSNFKLSEQSLMIDDMHRAIGKYSAIVTPE
jgi:hypothetical protein